MILIYLKFQSLMYNTISEKYTIFSEKNKGTKI